MFMDMSAYNNSQYDAPGYYVPSLQQRFFASRPLELLPIHREVIHTNQSESAGPSTSISHKKPEYAMPWWPTTVDATTSAADPTQLLLQPCLPWPLLTMSPAFSGDSALPELMPQSSPQTIYSASAFSAEALALMSLPSSPPPPMLSNMAALPTSLDDDQLFARIAECRANGMTWQDMSEVFSAQMGGSGLSATQLSYLYFRRNPEPLSATTTTHRFVPYTIKKSATAAAAARAQAERQAEAKLAYLNVDQFKQLQRLVSEYGESWDLISGIMGVRAGDLQKNWRGYSPRTIITRPWTRGEIEILSLCRAIGVCCRTTAKLIGTKLPLQCRRKTVKPADCLPSTSVHCPTNGPMYLVTAQKHQPSSSLAISRAFGLQQDCQAAQIEVDKGSLAVAREIVRLHASSVHEPGAGVRHMLELAHEAMPRYSQRTVDMCMLAILGSHPDYESGQQPPRSLLTAPPPYVKAAPVEPSPSPLSPVVETKDETTVVNDLHKWSSHEIAALREYVEENQGKKSWKTLALLLGTKTAAQCCNKYRSMRRYHKL